MEKTGKIIIADDDKDILLSARAALRKHFETVAMVQSIAELKERVSKEEFGAVLLDMNFRIGDNSGKDGLKTLEYLKEKNENIQVVIITAYADIEIAVKAIKNGAFDFIIKPWENKKLLATVRAAMQLYETKSELAKMKLKESMLTKAIDSPIRELVSDSKAMQELKDDISKVALTEANILILGENGTGKEIVAKTIHQASDRSHYPFIKIDLGSISQSLFESELFGHEKGAFTDAKEQKLGKIELANNGTLFLDEIGNLPMSLQSKLLSVLQNRKIVRIGGTKEIEINARVICATNMPLQKMIEEKSFRQDLYYRINTVELNVPPLRERKRDIAILAKHFLLVFAKKYKKGKLKIDESSLKKLKGYNFPGNVRELENIVERAVIMCNGQVLEFSDVLVSGNREEIGSKDFSIEHAEKETIKSALQKHAGNVSKAADEIGIGRTTIYRKMKRYGL